MGEPEGLDAQVRPLLQDFSDDEDDGDASASDCTEDLLSPSQCELRLDATDGNCYSKHSFVLEYGQQEGRRRWEASARLQQSQAQPVEGTPDSERTTAHRIRSFVLRSSQCKLCRLTGPSPQTGTAECALCRRCVSCCRRSPVCPLGDGAEPVPDAVCWGDGCGRVIRVQAGSKPGCVLPGVSGHPPMQPSDCLRFVPPSRAGGGGLLSFSNKVSVSLPVRLSRASRVLRQLRSLADAHAVSHDLPGGVDACGHALPRVMQAQRDCAGVVSCAVGVLTGRVATAHSDGTVRMWDMRSSHGRLMWQLRRSSPDPSDDPAETAPSPQAIDLSPCERYLAVAWRGGGVVSAATGAVEMNCKCQWSQSVVFSPCGRFLLGAGNQRLSVWGMKERTVLSYFMGVAGELSTCAAGSFSPNSGYVAVVATAEDTEGDGPAHVPALVSGWRQSFGEDAKLRRLPAATHRAEVVSLRFSADGRQLLSASADGLISVTDVASGDCVLSHSGAQELSSALFVGGGGAVAALCGARLRLWRNTELVADEPVTRGSRGLDIAGETVATGLPQGGVRLQPLPRVAGVPDWRRRVSHAHCGQRGLELLLLWQKRLRSTPPLPTGLMLARQLPPDVVKLLTEWLPAPQADEMVSTQAQCVIL
eukprot:TRINITY_DN4072_c0_g1_i1.p1 TRINITY_DN4072_c0_g1~~TRINITY_DN4072_c0_g1_i1.p1  ORF type:complete len:665 (+),score=138.28 TRINITY_DN4072_c0_g1_i1:59-1996(+)